MNEDTRKLLEECNSGCKMAVGSIDQVKEYARGEKLLQVLDRYKVQHERLEQRSTDLLLQAGYQEKEPGVMASSFSWISTEMKMLMKSDSQQIGKIMMDGCNMGIQSISEYRNQYTNAADEATDLATDIVKIEEDFVKDLEQFL